MGDELVTASPNSNDDDYDPDQDFLSLIDLAEKGWATCGVLATAIETSGVDGFDRFGRFRRFRPGAQDDEIALALDCVAECQRRGLDYGGEAFRDLEWQTWDKRRFGWKLKDLPKFSQYDVDEDHVPTRKASPKEEGNNLRIIGALLGCLLGTDGNENQPEFWSQTSLIDYLVKHYDGYPGLKERSLQEKFAAAKKSLKLS